MAIPGRVADGDEAKQAENKIGNRSRDRVGVAVARPHEETASEPHPLLHSSSQSECYAGRRPATITRQSWVEAMRALRGPEIQGPRTGRPTPA